MRPLFSWLYTDKVVFEGAEIGRYTVLSVFRSRTLVSTWESGDVWMLCPLALCQCSCGTIKVVRVANLKNKNTKSCGCHRDELVRQKSIVWDVQDSRLRDKWHNMIDRCYVSDSVRNRTYDSINVCDEWLNFNTFAKWCIENGWMPDSDLEIDRKNNRLDYGPDNCQLLTKAEHMAKSSTEKMVTT